VPQEEEPQHYPFGIDLRRFELIVQAVFSDAERADFHNCVIAAHAANLRMGSLRQDHNKQECIPAKEESMRLREYLPKTLQLGIPVRVSDLRIIPIISEKHPREESQYSDHAWRRSRGGDS